MTNISNVLKLLIIFGSGKDIIDNESVNKDLLYKIVKNDYTIFIYHLVLFMSFIISKLFGNDIFEEKINIK